MRKMRLLQIDCRWQSLRWPAHRAGLLALRPLILGFAGIRRTRIRKSMDFAHRFRAYVRSSRPRNAFPRTGNGATGVTGAAASGARQVPRPQGRRGLRPFAVSLRPQIPRSCGAPPAPLGARVLSAYHLPFRGRLRFPPFRSAAARPRAHSGFRGAGVTGAAFGSASLPPPRLSLPRGFRARLRRAP